jgi:CRISPR/Cas system-associated exonuclease Cas4 (RecB family)
MIDFNELINSFLSRKSKPKIVGKYYPSEAGNCLRKSWYSYKYPKEIDPEVRKIFEMGNLLHDFVSEVLKSEKTPSVELLKSELPFKIKVDDFIISGRADNLIRVKSSGKTYLVEVKSTKYLLKKPKKQNIIQLQLYMHALGIHKGIILYVEKSRLQSNLFEIEFDQKIVEDSLNRFRKLHKSLKEESIPIPEARIQNKEMGFRCNYCEYRNRCFEEPARV